MVNNFTHFHPVGVVLVAMLGIGLGAEAEIEELLNSLGANNIHVTANDMGDKEWRAVIKSTIGVSSRDRELVESLFPGAQVAELSVRTTKDRIEELLFARRRDLFSSL